MRALRLQLKIKPLNTPLILMVEAQIEFNALAIFVFLANKLVLHNLFKREDKCDITFY